MFSRSIRAPAAAAYRSAQLPRPSAARSMHVTSRCLAMSEQDHHKDEHDRKAEIDKHKQDTLDKQKQGAGQWKRELASSSEAAVKADRGDIKASEENIQQMQKETEELANKERGKK